MSKWLEFIFRGKTESARSNRSEFISSNEDSQLTASRIDDWVLVNEEQQRPEDNSIEENSFEPMAGSVASLVEFPPTLGSAALDHAMKERFRLFLQEQQQHSRVVVQPPSSSPEIILEPILPVTPPSSTSLNTLSVSRSAGSSPSDFINAAIAQVENIRIQQQVAYDSNQTVSLSKKSARKQQEQATKASHYSKPVSIPIQEYLRNQGINSRMSNQFSHRTQNQKKGKGRKL